MTTMFQRTKHVMSVAGIVTFVIIPIEVLRAVATGISIVPLLLFSNGEYILTGEQTNTVIWGDTLEFAGKRQIKNLAKKAGVDDTIN